MQSFVLQKKSLMRPTDGTDKKVTKGKCMRKCNQQKLNALVMEALWNFYQNQTPSIKWDQKCNIFRVYKFVLNL